MRETVWKEDYDSKVRLLRATEAERDHWKANHDRQVAVNHELRRRPDLVRRIDIRDRDAMAALAWLLDRSCWFDWTPLPDGLFAASVKIENEQSLLDFLKGLKP